MSLSPSTEKFVEHSTVVSAAAQASLTQEACAIVAIATMQKFCELLSKCQTIDEVRNLIKKSIEVPE